MLKISFAPFAVISSDASWTAFGPELCLLAAAIVLMLLAALRAEHKWALVTTLVGIFGALAFVFTKDASFPDPAGVSYLQFDAYSKFFTVLFLLVATITCLLSIRYLERRKSLHSEFFALVLFATIGMIVMVSSRDLLVMYLGLETMSITAYILAGYLLSDRRSLESSIKYFLTGALGSAIFLFGMAYMYGATGSIQFDQIGMLAAQKLSSSSFFAIGATFLLAGFAFKVAAVPFHMWAPDVYEGAPTPVTGLMSVGIKAAAFAVLARLVFVSLDIGSSLWFDVLLAGLCAGTMIWGNIAAIAQSSIKRMLAYSSIGHAGYLLLAIAARSDSSSTAIQFYLIAYTLMNLGAFGIVVIFEKARGQQLSIAQYAGLGTRYPALAISLSIFLFSLAGIPPTAGFVGKWLVFGSAIATKQSWLILLAVLGVMTSLVSAYYYLRVVYVMFMMPPDNASVDAEVPYPIEQRLTLTLAVGVILIGCFPQAIVALAQQGQLKPIAREHAKYHRLRKLRTRLLVPKARTRAKAPVVRVPPIRYRRHGSMKLRIPPKTRRTVTPLRRVRPKPPAPARRPDARPAPARRPDTRPAPARRPDARPAPARRPEARPAPARRPEVRTAPAKRPEARPAPAKRPNARPAPARRPDARPAPAKRPEARPAPARRPAAATSRPAPRAPAKAATRATPTSRPTSRPASR